MNINGGSNLEFATVYTVVIFLIADLRQIIRRSPIGPGPDAPVWMNDCFERYLGLLDGVFRTIRPEPSNESSSRQIRVYHSGSIWFD
jgi:hypothetical protein